MMSEEQVEDLVVAIQHGDYNAVKDALRRRVINPNVKDSQGCSLLHWAAINNRYSIANLLIDNGVDINTAGGVLEENPVQWAIRKKYYSMVDLLIRKGNDVLKHTSKSGDDALSLALKSRDANMMILLLHWGSNPNRIVDSDGDTHLLALLKSANGPSYENIEFIRLLLRFGADPSIPDVHGNNALHVLAQCKGMVNAYMVHDICAAGGPAMSSAKNKSGQTAYQLAKFLTNSKVSGILFDEMLFQSLPYYVPSVATALTYASLYFFVLWWGIIFGSIAALLLLVIVLAHVQQWAIPGHRSRAQFGYLVGGIVVLMYAYYRDITPHVSLAANCSAFGLALATLYSGIAFHRQKPAAVIKPLRNALVSQIIQSSPREGTYEEFEAQQQSTLPTGGGLSGMLGHAEELGLTPQVCTVCMVDRYKNASHCKHCGYCILDRDQHVEYLGNCTGRGNMRMYLIFLLAATAAALTLAAHTYWVQANALCRDSRGIFWSFFAVEWCIVRFHPQLFGVLMTAILCILCFASGLNQHVMIIAWETTLLNVYMGKFMYADKRITIGKACSTLLSFCVTGVHKVVTPDMLVNDTTALLGIAGAQKLQLSSNGPGQSTENGGTIDSALGRRSEELVGADEDYIEVMWADEEELKQIKRMQKLGGIIGGAGSRGVRGGHSHAPDGKCCSHHPEPAPARDISLPPVTMNMSVDDRV